MSNVAKALEAERSGQYQTAIDIYTRLSREMNSLAFELNIERATKLLNLHTNKLSFGTFVERANIDRVYVLNLPSRPDKKLRVVRELRRVGLDDFEIVNAVEGATSTYAKELLNAYQSRVTNKSKSSQHIPAEAQRILKQNSTLGTFGYLLTQQQIFQDAIAKNYRRICIFDDDVIFLENYSTALGAANALLERGFSILHLGASEYSDPYPVDGQEIADHYIATPHKTCGSFATVYDNSVFKEILQLVDEMDGPFDNVSLGSIYSKFPLVCGVIHPNICAADVHSSDIRTPRDQFKHSAKMRWNLGQERYFEYKKAPVFNIIIEDVCAFTSSPVSYHYAEEDLRVRFYYAGEDGLRPLHSKKSFRHQDEVDSVKRKFNELFFLTDDSASFNNFSLPAADLTLLWPGSNLPTKRDLINIALKDLHHQDVLNSYIPEHRVISKLSLQVMEKGLASVIIPCARAFEDVKETIDSVISQSYQSIEIIMVIDSPSAQIDMSYIRAHVNRKIKDLANGLDRRFHLVQHRRIRFGCGARNTGISLAKGEFISFLDDDDLYNPNRLSATIAFLENRQNSDISACYCSYTGIWSQTEGLEEERFRTEGLAKSVLSLDYQSHFIHTGTVTYRREPLLDMQGFDEKYERHQDIEFNTRFLLKYKVGFVRYVGLIFKPRRHKIKPTVSMTLEKMLKIKKYLLEDFDAYISGWPRCDVDQFINNHASDFAAFNTGMDLDLKVVVEKVLASYRD